MAGLNPFPFIDRQCESLSKFLTSTQCTCIVHFIGDKDLVSRCDLLSQLGDYGNRKTRVSLIS